MRLIFIELSCLQKKIANFHVEIDPHDLEICVRSMSSICKLNQDTLRTHPWYKFGPNETNICWVIVFTSENCKFSCWNRPPWPRKIGHGHPSSNLTKTLLRKHIHGISLSPMRLIFVELLCLQEKIANFHVEIDPHDLEICVRSMSSICKLNQYTPRIHPWYKFGPNANNICRVIVLTSENCKFSCWNRPPWPRKIGQGHPSSNLTKTLLRKHIHGISLSPMRLIFVELSCLQEKIANFHVEIDPHDLEICVRSMSPICKLSQDTLRTHPWYKFGPNATNICWVIVFTSKICKFSCWNRPPWPRKIGQGHPSSNLTKTLLRHINGKSLAPM